MRRVPPTSQAPVWVALGIAVLWGISYIVAIVTSRTEVVTVGTPVAMLACGYLLGGELIGRGK